MTTASETKFVTQMLLGKDGRRLYVDGNQKISGWDPVANAFSLVQIADCPYATPSCKAACYVQHLEQHQPDVHALYVSNSRTIREILASPERGYWIRNVVSYVKMTCGEVGFRWHVSGDVFSLDYAAWIAAVCVSSPNVRHWIYTRSLPFVSELVRAPNLTVNLSADRDNFQQVVRAHAVYPQTRICYMTVDGYVPELPKGSVIFPDYNLRGSKRERPRDSSAWWQGLTREQRRQVCPVDQFGKGPAIRCGRCTKCIKPVTP